MASQLLINEPPLQVLPSLAKAIGLNEAIVLQQVHYWLNPQFNRNYFEDRYWVFNTYEQWHKQFPFWSERTLQRITASLEGAGLILTFVTGGFKKVKYYTIDYARLSRLEGDQEEPGPGASLPELPGFTPSRQPGAPDHGTLPSPAVSGYFTSRQAGVLEPDTLSSPVTTGCHLPSRQPGVPDHDSLSRSLTENTPEITSEITPLPPLPPSARAGLQGQPCQEGDREQTGEGECAGPGEPFDPVEPELSPGRICLDMLDTWNHTVQALTHPGSPVSLTASRRVHLLTFRDTVLAPAPGHPPLASWQDYCSLVASSRFLTGSNQSGFKASLDWALNPANAAKVLEGTFFDRPQKLQHPPSASTPSPSPAAPVQPWEDFVHELVPSLPAGPLGEDWLVVSLALAKSIGQIKYKSWFLKVALTGLSDTTATLQVEGRFFQDYIYNHFRDGVLRAVKSHCPSVTEVEYLLASSKGNVT